MHACVHASVCEGFRSVTLLPFPQPTACSSLILRLFLIFVPGISPLPQLLKIQLRATFEKMPNDIPLLLFVEKGQDDVFTQASRQVIRAFRELSDRITLREFDLGHELAQQGPRLFVGIFYPNVGDERFIR